MTRPVAVFSTLLLLALVLVISRHGRLEEGSVPGAVGTGTGPAGAENASAPPGSTLPHPAADPKTSTASSAPRILSPAEKAKRMETLKSQAVALADTDWQKAVGWARKIEEPAERDAVLLQLAYECAADAPEEALKLSRELPPSNERDALVRHAVLQWASKDPDRAAEWARQIEGATLRDQALAAVAIGAASEHPVEAAKLATNELPPGRTQENAIISIVQRWAQTDPAAASQWVETFPDGDLKQVALENLAQAKFVAKSPGN